MRFSKILLVLALLLVYNGLIVAKVTKHKTYMIHVDRSVMPRSFNDHVQWYELTLKSVSNSAKMLYAYHEVMQGFSATLTPDEAKQLENQLGVLSVQEEKAYKLHTTRTPLFLGINKAEQKMPNIEAVENVIIGLLDTGIWPESKSFNDSGLGPVPNRWKGVCQEGTNFTKSNCNHKLIGARYFSEGYEAKFGPINETLEYKSPRDSVGHGTHTSTTAAGTLVNNVSLFGYALGSARGIAMNARVAMYKVCWSQYGCSEADLAAGMDSAIQDGVDIVSLSIGGSSPEPYEMDPLALGAFTAMTKGIFVALSASNEGPYSNSLKNFAPWQTIVGAGTLDRDFPAYVSLGNGKKHFGISLHDGNPQSTSIVPVVYAGNISSDPECTNKTSLPRQKVEGKIVLCDWVSLGIQRNGCERCGRCRGHIQK